MPYTYTNQNIFNEKDISKRYHEFLIGDVNVEEIFKNLFLWVNEKIILPDFLWKDVPPLVRIIDFGIGAGKFTIPHIKTLVDMGVNVQVLGFDNSKNMLLEFKQNAKKILNVEIINDEFVNNSNTGIKKIKLVKLDFNDIKQVEENLDSFYSDFDQNQKEVTLIYFAQTEHYLQSPQEFFNKIIFEKLNGSYVIHYEPIYYFKLLDGNFDQTNISLDFSSDEKAQLHRNFWMKYFSFRDKIRPYSSGQKIKATNLDFCFEMHKKKNSIYLGWEKIEWEKEITFNDLINLIEDPIFSSHYVGLSSEDINRLAKLMSEEFLSEKENFEGKFKCGYIGHLFSLKKYDDKHPLKLNFKKNENESENIINVEGREVILDNIKALFPNIKFLFIGATYVNRFRFEGFKNIELTSLNPWQEFIENLRQKKIPSIAEILYNEKIDSLWGTITYYNGPIHIETPEERIKNEVERVLLLLHNYAVKKIHLLKGKTINFLFFLLFPPDHLESIFMNLVVTIIVLKSNSLTKESLQPLIDRLRVEWRDMFNEEMVKIYKEFQSHALRSAVAAIMSRNMSHNIGSHVLAKMGYASFAELNLPQSQILYKYMQQRMDFVAITSTEFPQWSYPTWFLKELMRWFYQQETLLEFIAKQEGIKGLYKWAKSKNDEENKNTLLIRIRYNNGWIIHEDQKKEKIDKEGLKNDFSLAIPGGIIGYHAFYVILEDIIRNSAKHNWASLSNQQKEEKKQLGITIDIENKEENDFVTFRIYDNISETENILNHLPLNYEELTPGEMEKLPLHQKMNVYLTRSFIDNTGQLKKENWGLQEMKISAGYLNKSNVEDIGKNGEEVLDILKAVAVKDPEENDKYRLGYEFKIPKPKTVAIIGKNEKIKKKFNTSEAKKYGIYYFENTPPDFDYEFMILIDDSTNDVQNKVLKNLLNNPEYEIEKLPYRLFVLTDREIPPQIEKRVVKIDNSKFKDIFNGDYEKFKINLYKKWIEKLKNGASNYPVYIDFAAPQSDKWDLELFKKCENLIKTFAKAEVKKMMRK
jgi:hypothetical protein